MSILNDLDYLTPTDSCRICLKRDADLFDIFSEHPVEQGATIAQILRECTSYTVERVDKLPQQICNMCINDACFAYRFRRTADAGYRYLTGIYGQAQKPNMLVENSTQTDDNCNENTFNDINHFSWMPQYCARCDGRLSAADGIYDDAKYNVNEFPAIINNCNNNSSVGVGVGTGVAVNNNADDGDTKIGNFSKQTRSYHRANKLLGTDCKLCGEQFRRLLQLREHLMQEHVYSELINELQCRLCENLYSRKDHVKRHLRNIHKISHCRVSDTIIIEEPVTETMGQWINQQQANTGIEPHEPICKIEKNDMSVCYSPDSDMYDQQDQWQPQIETYWHAPEFVQSGNNCSSDNVYKITVPKVINAVNSDPLTEMEYNDDFDSNINANDLDLLELDIKPHIIAANAEQSDYKIEIKAKRNCKPLDQKSNYSHRKSATPRLPRDGEESFLCDICNRLFFRKYHLQRHLLVHTKEKFYQCQHCSKDFARSDQLSRHLKDSCKALRQKSKCYS